MSEAKMTDVFANKTLGVASPYELAMAKSFVNDYIMFQKLFKGRIMPFKSIVHFAAGCLLPDSSYESAISEEQRNLIKAVYYEYAP